MSHKPDPIDALHSALLSSHGGIAAGARAIGRSAQVLYNKFSDSMPGNELTGREERALADAVGGTAYVEAVCSYFGGVFFRVPEGMAGDDDVLEAYLDIIKRMGELSSDFMAARADGVVDPGEFNGLRDRAFSTMAALRHLLAELETMVMDVPSARSNQRQGSSTH